jgi:hypothetical protein
MLSDGDIQPGIARRALAKILKQRLDAAHIRGDVTHTMEQGSIFNALDKKHWEVWPIQNVR